MYSGINPSVLLFLGVVSLLMLMLPRRWAFAPLIATACYMTMGQGIEIGPFSFSVLRLVGLVGVIRVVSRGEGPSGGFNALDRLFFLWAVAVLFSSFFRNNPSEAIITRLGHVYDASVIYFLVRVFCSTVDDVKRLCKTVVLILVPVAASMTYEKLYVRNVFSVFGAVSERPSIRGGRTRAQGPFRHSILAGTVGAGILPMGAALATTAPLLASTGIVSGALMVYSSASSGPVMSALAAIVGLCAWPMRRRMRLVRYSIVAAYLALELVMNRPAYFIIASIDITGSSTGWHRAALIQSAIRHFNEWWLAGTDYTRHWMPTGVTWSPDHTDITNLYLAMGVLAGFPCLLFFILMIAQAFRILGRALAARWETPGPEKFFLWSLGATLFMHSVTFLSVNYYDQSKLFVYLLLAVIGSQSGPSALPVSRPVPQPEAGRSSYWRESTARRTATRKATEAQISEAQKAWLH